MKEINWKVTRDKTGYHPDEYYATLEDENGNWLDWMVGSFDTVKNYIGEQMKDALRFKVTWPDGNVSEYLKIEFPANAF